MGGPPASVTARHHFGRRFLARSGGVRDNATPAARLVVSHRANCHTQTWKKPAEANHNEPGRLRQRDGNATARLNAGEGKERNDGVTTMIDSPAAARSGRPRARRRGTFGADKLWALAFVTPYVAIFVAFVIYPIGYGLWLGSDPASYRALFGDPVYPRTVVNTLLYLLFGVNLKLLLALLLSGFFMRKGWWTKSCCWSSCCPGRCRRCPAISPSTGC